jgi:hypothetical protein
MTSQDLGKFICSQALEPGLMPSASQDGPKTAKCGVGRFPASPSVQPGSAAVQMTLAIFGPNGSASSESATLQSSLVNKLRQRMASLGSTLFVLTWKVRVTPSRRSIYALRARRRRTSGSVCTSWPTPTVTMASLNVDESSWNGHYYLKPDGRKNQTDLQQAAMQASWATPASRDWRDGSASDETMNRNNRPLNEQVSHWATPTGNNATGAGDQGRDGGENLQTMVSGLTSNGFPAETDITGQLNPAFSLWLQGLPTEWLNYAP